MPSPRASVKKLTLSKMVCKIVMFCAATAIASSAQTLTTLVNFNNVNGAFPYYMSLVQGSDGSLYGTTSAGGAHDSGTVFNMTLTGSLTILHSFADGAEGGAPRAGLVRGTDGNFYGTTWGGLPYGLGTVFQITPAGAFTTIYSFTGGADGASPYAPLVQGADGNLYGTTSNRGMNGYGTVFKITPTGTFTSLYSFCSQSGCTDGATPWAGLVQASDGNFYGTTRSGGTGGDGTVFKITPNGAFTTLHRFSGADGAVPFAGLVQANDGNFYGTTYEGGPSNFGTVFRISPTGTLTSLYSFCSQDQCTDGKSPTAGLVQANDGNFYGTTSLGGNASDGTIFTINTVGTLTTLYSFCTQHLCTDGALPYGGLTQAGDGNLYGTTYEGGTGILPGTVLRLSLSNNNYTLTASVSGSGTVTSTDGFINCPGTCSHSYPVNTPVTLNATPAQGWTFTGWSGACTGTGPCNLTITQDTSVSATFTQNQNLYTLSVSTLGSGSVTSTDGFITCPETCSHNYPAGSPVSLTASPAQNWNFSGWSGACTGVGSCNLTMTNNLAVSAFFNQPGGGLLLSPVVPCRLVDTRSSQGGGGPIPGGSYQTFVLPQLSQAKGCGDLSSAAAYSLNVTLVPQNGSPVSYLTIWPTGLAQPLVSTMNSLDGRIKANAAIVPGGTNSAVNVYVTNTTDVVIDIDGFFASTGHATLLYHALPPCRIADTRKDTFPPGLGTPHLSAGVERDLPVLASSCIPAGVTPAAYSLNVTAIPYPSPGSQLGYLELWPKDQEPQHRVSTLNNPTGTYVANGAILPAGTGSEITAYASSDTELAIDINGYFAESALGGMSLYPTAPCRVFDSRHTGNGQPFSGTLNPPVDVTNSPCAAPASAQAYVFNSTVVPSPTLSYLTLWPDGQQQPVVSTLNAADGYITSNMAIVPSTNGKIDAFAGGTTQLILDISSYFAP